MKSNIESTSNLNNISAVQSATHGKQMSLQLRLIVHSIHGFRPYMKQMEGWLGFNGGCLRLRYEPDAMAHCYTQNYFLGRDMGRPRAD
jgi:hypothetical protein